MNGDLLQFSYTDISKYIPENVIVSTVLYVEKAPASPFAIHNGILNGSFLFIGYDITDGSPFLAIYDAVSQSFRETSAILPPNIKFLQSAASDERGILFLGSDTQAIHLDFKSGNITDISQLIPVTIYPFMNAIINGTYFVQGWSKLMGWGFGPPSFWSYDPTTGNVLNLTECMRSIDKVYPITKVIRAYDHADNRLLCSYGTASDVLLIEYDVTTGEAKDLTNIITNFTGNFVEGVYNITFWIVNGITWTGDEFILCGRPSSGLGSFSIAGYDPSSEKREDLNSLFLNFSWNTPSKYVSDLDSTFWNGEKVVFVGTRETGTFFFVLTYDPLRKGFDDLTDTIHGSIHPAKPPEYLSDVVPGSSNWILCGGKYVNDTWTQLFGTLEYVVFPTLSADPPSLVAEHESNVSISLLLSAPRHFSGLANLTFSPPEGIDMEPDEILLHLTGGQAESLNVSLSVSQEVNWGHHSVVMRIGCGKRSVDSILDLYVNPVSTSITCLVTPNESAAGSSIEVAGEITPAVSSKTVKLTYTRPDGTVFERRVIASQNGSYIESFAPDASGPWGVKASWEGDEIHSAATSSTVRFYVREIDYTPYLLAGIIVICSGVVVLFVFKSKKTS